MRRGPQMNIGLNLSISNQAIFEDFLPYFLANVTENYS